MGHHNNPPTTSPLNITILTIATILVLSLLILIIGPSRILSDATSASTAQQCPQIIITNPTPNPNPNINPNTNNLNPVLHTPKFDGAHFRIYNDSPVLQNTHKDALHPLIWEEILTPGHAAVGLRVQESTVSHLDDYPGIKAENSGNEQGLGLGLAMMHQLHCLISIRGLIFTENTNRVNSTSSPHMTGEEKRDMDHWAHCFDYIAQALICAADDTLERPKKVLRDGKAWWHVDGNDAVHKCKDPRPLWEMSLRSHAHPVDMSRWRDGIGAREYFAEELKDGYRYDIPDVWRLGMVGGPEPLG
ncbi:hypothetical protein BJY04DRAFT_226407 [Aspergillus karnatakaensis]|uniref:uncharacterized protein n=1 Tax=Aspergillus karnatakaensis TaxID=1810916 RepID=UPI003CCE06A4